MSALDNTAWPPRGSIAVLGQWRPTDPAYGKFPIPYAHAVSSVGGGPVVLSTFPLKPAEPNPEKVPLLTGLDPEDPSPLDGMIGLVVPGGGDIDPAWYGRDRHPRTANISHQRDRFELTMLEAALERDMPVLAICHGMQLLNVHLGGTLDQHLADRHTLLEHDRDRPRAEAAHSLRIKPGCILERIVGSQRIPVNSHHHQGLGIIATSLEEIAWAEDSVLEAVVSREHSWVLGVQWHPEAMAPVDHSQRAIFAAFVEACESFAARSREARSA